MKCCLNSTKISVVHYYIEEFTTLVAFSVSDSIELWRIEGESFTNPSLNSEGTILYTVINNTSPIAIEASTGTILNQIDESSINSTLQISEFSVHFNGMVR